MTSPRPSTVASPRLISLVLIAAIFIGAGTLHLLRPSTFVGMVPPWLPMPMLLVVVSGVCELLGGVGVLVPATRVAAGWGLIALLVAVFPANVFMALRNAQPPRRTVDKWVLWVRLPLQAIFVAWVWWTAAAKPRENSPG